MLEKSDTFTFVSEGDRIRIYQHYKSATEGGAISTPIGSIMGNGIEWTCEAAPLPLARLIGLGILSAMEKITDLVDEAEEAVPGTFVQDEKLAANA